MYYLKEYLVNNFPLFFLIAAFVWIANPKKKEKGTELGFVWFAIGCAVLLSLQTVGEEWAAGDPSRMFWRVLFSYLGYILRPASILALIFIVETDFKRRMLLLIPGAVNLVVMAGCFFSPLVFSYTNDENYEFVRGPLGWLPFVVMGIYLIVLLLLTEMRRLVGERHEVLILTVCTAFSIYSVLLDMFLWGNSTNLAIAISSIFYYLFLTSRLSGMDSVTHLLNRDAFHRDSHWRFGSITAIAVFDMNGLKRVNDGEGHLAGDEALATVGRGLSFFFSRKVSCYRVGGDEFTVLFRNTETAEAEEICRKMKEKIAGLGVSVSAGFAEKQEGDTFEMVWHRADVAMYRDKELFYSVSENDRREGGSRTTDGETE